MKINEKLLTAWYEREIPDSDLLALVRPLKNLKGEERTVCQNSIADHIVNNYLLRKDIRIQQQDK